MAATATASKVDELRELLALDGETDLATVAKLFDEKTLAIAWAAGDIEIGRTKYIVTGNPDVPESLPTLVIEDGMEWSGPKKQWHGRFADIIKDSLPECRFYEKYQREVCVNRDKDVWEWLEPGTKAGARETRWARRKIERKEAESLFSHRIKLTDKGMAALQS